MRLIMILVCVLVTMAGIGAAEKGFLEGYDKPAALESATDENKSFALEIRRGVVQFHESLPENLDVSITSTRAFMNKMLVGDVHITGEMSAAIADGAPAGGVVMMNAIDNGDIKVDKGTKEDVQNFFSYFDSPVDVDKINLIVR